VILTGFLGNPSRDLRVAAVRSLRDICDPVALEALRRQRDVPSELPQVVRAIEEAIEAIEQCAQ
jgi:hypothetical protein